MDPLIITIDSKGGSTKEISELSNQIIQADKDGRPVIIIIDNAGSNATCRSFADMYRINLNDVEIMPCDVKPTFVKHE